ncbi:MAG: histidine phosphatase family protein [Clostridia bacterium]|nr:histidine phosphatase family protein [Clostridia bacterium]
MREKSTEFVLVRHGQTQWNREQVFRGHTDVALSEEGRAQAEATAAALRALPLTAVYSSRLARAWETATAIAAPHRLVPQEEPGLLDLSFGTWEGLSVEEVARRYPELYRRWREAPHTVVFPQGEGLATVRHRVERLLAHLPARHRGETICLVSHRVVNKVLLLTVLGLGNEHFWCIEQDTCCLNRFRYTGGRFIVSGINDTCHLRRPPTERETDF